MQLGAHLGDAASMPYLIDRSRALWDRDIVVIVGVRRRRVRSRVILRDNSLYHTLTRPRTLIRHANTKGSGMPGIGANRRKG